MTCPSQTFIKMMSKGVSPCPSQTFIKMMGTLRFAHPTSVFCFLEKMNRKIDLDWKGRESGDRFILKPYPEEKRTFR